MKKKEIQKATPEDIRLFLEGKDDEKYITGVELDQTGDWSEDNSNRVYVTIDDPKKGKQIKVYKFVPFYGLRTYEEVGFMVMM